MTVLVVLLVATMCFGVAESTGEAMQQIERGLQRAARSAQEYGLTIKSQGYEEPHINWQRVARNAPTGRLAIASKEDRQGGVKRVARSSEKTALTSWYAQEKMKRVAREAASSSTTVTPVEHTQKREAMRKARSPWTHELVLGSEKELNQIGQLQQKRLARSSGNAGLTMTRVVEESKPHTNSERVVRATEQHIFQNKERVARATARAEWDMETAEEQQRISEGRAQRVARAAGQAIETATPNILEGRAQRAARAAGQAELAIENAKEQQRNFGGRAKRAARAAGQAELAIETAKEQIIFEGRAQRAARSAAQAELAMEIAKEQQNYFEGRAQRAARAAGQAELAIETAKQGSLEGRAQRSARAAKQAALSRQKLEAGLETSIQQRSKRHTELKNQALEEGIWWKSS